MEMEVDPEMEVNLEIGEEDLAVEEEMEIKDDIEKEMLVVTQETIMEIDAIIPETILETEGKT